MSAKHTQGPWVVETIDGEMRVSSSIRRYLGAPDGYRIATICDDRWAGDQETANARAIAATPDLISTLIDIADMLDGEIDVEDGKDGQPKPNKAMRIVQMIDAALDDAGCGRDGKS